MNEELEQAQKLLEEDRIQRARLCQEAIDELLHRFGCKFDVAMVLRPGEAPKVVMHIVAE